MSAATTPSSGTAGGGGGAGAGPPPLPPTKPVLSSPGAYMANYNSGGGGGGGGSGSATAGIHSVNKQYAEKPAIAARPVPPPTLPKYTSSFGKIDRAEREKVCVVATVEDEECHVIVVTRYYVSLARVGDGHARMRSL